MSDEGEYRLLFEFVDQSPSFAHGFEAGKLCQRMQGREMQIELAINVQNQAMMSRMAQHYGYRIELSPLPGADDWLDAVFVFVGKETLDRQRLVLVPRE